MADTFPADEAKLVSIFVQTLLYGLFCVLFFASLYVLRQRVKTNTGNMGRTLLGTLITMFILATMHIGVNFTRIIKAFIAIGPSLSGGPSAYFNELSNFTNIFGSTIYVAQTLVGDAFVNMHATLSSLYRCSLIWGRRYWIVAFPSLLLAGSTVSGVGILYSFAKISTDTVIFAAQLNQWITAFFVLTLSTNIICTALVAFRIWHINKLSIRVGAGNLTPVLLVVVESGMIYSATLITLLVTYECGSWAQYLMLDAVSPIVGITFSLVILRLSIGLSDPDGVTRPFQDIPSTSGLWGRQHDPNLTNTQPNIHFTKSNNTPADEEIDLGFTTKNFGTEENAHGRSRGRKMKFGLGSFGNGGRQTDTGLSTTMTGITTRDEGTEEYGQAV
ncbi:hypothetical protein OE88DRAFT_1131761 [Heliocybe sulcata]|uniref:Uncharacterized protein n=1 Tax=Heliocybe sulcata TaxID=5364 RepID=A0A5C3NBU6_9AGAM|nr:hypothetical protein OE88DRAFT_1131761 [Heliocybe sulcata]